MIVIDTDILIEIFDKKSALGESALDKIAKSNEPFCTTSINQHEVLYGIFKYGKGTDDMLQIPTLSYTRQDAAVSSRLEYALEAKGKKTARMDTMIAAIAINNGAKLYTANHKHFKEFAEFGLQLF